MHKPQAFRLLLDAALDGPANMARDEALMDSQAASTATPTLRLYQWSVPTISLGYFQRYGSIADLDEPLRQLPVVRRQTGGGAILHDLELTYSIAIAPEDPLIDGAPNQLYELAHAAIAQALAELNLQTRPSDRTDDSGAAKGPFFCFARRHAFDLLIGADKIVGSAQRRRPRAVLQHGSIILGNRFMLQPTAIVPGDVRDNIAKLAGALPRHFEKKLARSVTAGDWYESELARAKSLRAKYAGDEWTKRT